MEFIYQKEKNGMHFQWITNLEITKRKALEFAQTGRKRWMIENKCKYVMWIACLETANQQKVYHNY